MLSISLHSKSPVLSPCLVNGCHQGPAKSVEVKQRPHCWLSLLSVQRDSPEVPIERAESAYLLWGKQAAAPPSPLLRKSVCKLGSMLSPTKPGRCFPMPSPPLPPEWKLYFLLSDEWPAAACPEQKSWNYTGPDFKSCSRSREYTQHSPCLVDLCC